MLQLQYQAIGVFGCRLRLDATKTPGAGHVDELSTQQQFTTIDTVNL